MRNKLNTCFILICLVVLSGFCIVPIEAQSQPDITVRADGSVNPSTSSIQQSGNTYFLTTDIAANITVQKSDMVLDGNGFKVDSLAIGIGVASISNVTVKNIVVNGTSGFFFYNWQNFENKLINGPANCYGILVYNGSNVLLTNNTVINTMHPGIFVSTAGIDVVGGSSNRVIGNNLENNSDGLFFSYSQNNVISENRIATNHGWFMEWTWGISFFHSSNNTVFENNFIHNHAQVGSEDSTNSWDNGRVGNYWSDYNGTDSNRDGVGDVPYKVNEGQAFRLSNPDAQADHYPLMQPFDSAFYLLVTTPPKISLLSPLSSNYNERNSSLLFSLDKPVSWIGYSLDGQQNVTITGNCTLTNISKGSHNITVYANDTFGNIGASTGDFIVGEPFPIVSVVAVSVAVVLAAAVGLTVYLRKRRSQQQ